MKPQVVANHQDPVLAFGLTEQTGNSVERVADWFLDEHVRTRPKCRARRFHVQAGRIGDQHHVGPTVQSCFKLGEFAGIDAQRFRLACARLATDRDRAQAERRPVAGVTAANRTEADDQRVQRSLHLVSGP